MKEYRRQMKKRRGKSIDIKKGVEQSDKSETEEETKAEDQTIN